MHPSTILALCTALAAGATAQVNPRPSQLVDTTTTNTGNLPSIASDGDLVAVAYNDPGGTNAVYVVTSDGRGLNWTAPVQVDQGAGASAKITQFDSCAVFGQNVYVVWRDLRSGSEMYFNRSTDGGATFGTEQRLDKGYADGTGAVRDFAFSASSALDLYVLMTVDPTGSADEELYVTASHDGGVTWSSAVRVDSASSDVDDIDIAADPLNPLTAHLVWADDRAGNSARDDLWYRQTADGGATFTAAEVQLDSSGPLVGDVDFEPVIQAEGPIVGVVWQEERASTSNEEAWFTNSIDGGLTFAPDQLVGTYTPGTDDVDFATLGVYGGTFYVGWDDDRTGTDLVYVISGAPGLPGSPVSFRPETVMSSAESNIPRFAGDANGTIVGVNFGVEFATGDEYVGAGFTEDGGTTWITDLQASEAPAGLDADFIELTYNARYRNFVTAWLWDSGSPAGTTRNRVYTGGYRPQTCTVIGWDDIYDPASTTLQFTCSGFGADTVALIGIAQGPGPLTVLPDGRLWDLAPDGTLGGVLGAAGFVAPLAGGSGSTLALPNIFAGSGPPLGITYHFAAAGFDANSVSNLTDSFTFQL